MKDTVERYIRLHALLEKDAPVAVALSGGADSVALALVLRELGYSVVALHCNFHLRGEESCRDEAFVRGFCEERDVELKVKHFSTREYAAEHGLGVEMAARELRYRWFEEERSALSAQAIAVAHHRDDQAETLLLNIVRGTGLRGLAAMRPKRDNVVRPLLCVSKDDILRYLEQKGQSFVTDSTNLERETFRNVLRLDIIPLLEKANPRTVDNMADTCRIVQDSIQVYRKGIEILFAENGVSGSRFPLATLHNHQLARTLLYEWLYAKGFSEAQLGEMATPSTVCGKVWQSATHRVLRDRDALLLEGLHAKDDDVSVTVETVDAIGDKAPHIAYFDAELITRPLVIRTVKQGDWFVPFGMKGRKLISDFLTNQKVSVFDKERQKVMTCGDDIVWVLGRRSDNRYRVTDRTKSILKVTLSGCGSQRS